ncbi:MAG: DUF2125 domain-containing protein [Yoonia sp.]|uniref:DUF2125 domain-containing protein n=1 Tax=Yoonia sp. TaxID=2212373 RepID=UPI00273E0B77|nr:DUF2125 domain-containing protein [Yoonia sp.]MDP5086353.1 DUF2125 domain-containing protein [Yoonia sp.]
MTNSTGMRSAVCLAALIAGGAAHAEVTAAQVWADWQSQLAQYGEGSVTIGAEETSSGTLTVRNLGIRFSDDDIVAETLMSAITFNEQSDGTVRVTMDESYPVTVTGEDGVVITIDISQQNMEMIVSGDADALDYDITASQYKVALRDVVDADVTFTGDVEVAANDLKLSYQTAVGEMRDITYSGTVASIDLLVDFQIPGGDGEYVTAGGRMVDMQTQAAMTLPLDANFEDPDTMINAGFAFAGGYTIDSGDFVFDINADGDQTSGSMSTGTSTFTGEMNSTALGYSSNTVDVALSFLSSGFPLPIEINLAEYGAGFQMPTGASDEPSDFAFNLDMVDLSISDAIWDLFDAGNVLPRDPATIQIALAGKAKSLYDMFDPAQQDAFENAEMPFELSEVTLETLNIDAAGAQVSGSGAFTFDNTDMQSFAPLPRPEGEARVEITGFNGLLDNLVAMGLVPEQDVMGARMMVGMFARATGDDQMETSVEIDAGGQVRVNGNRVR